MLKILGGSLTLILACLPGTSYAAPYGGCPNTAQSYQDRYRAAQRVEDLVCMQQALERELGVTGVAPTPAPRTTQNHVQPAPKSGPSYSRQQTYCLESFYGRPEAEYRNCVAKQDRAREQIDAFIASGDLSKRQDKRGDLSQRQDKVSTCSGYTTGLRGLGSAENIDLSPVAQCMTNLFIGPVFESCVSGATGRAWNDGDAIFWHQDEAVAVSIAACFNRYLTKSSPSTR